MLLEDKSNHQCFSGVNSLTSVSKCLTRSATGGTNSGTNVTVATNHFWSGFKVCFTRLNLWLSLLMRPRNELHGSVLGLLGGTYFYHFVNGHDVKLTSASLHC